MKKSRPVVASEPLAAKPIADAPPPAPDLVVVSRASVPSGAPVEIAAIPRPQAPFAAVSAAEALALALSPPQRAAIQKLTSGHTLADAASAAGVNRTTLYRWLNSDPEFKAAYNAWQHDALATARGRLLALADTAVAAVGNAMLKGDGRLALKLLQQLGVAKHPDPGPIDPEEVKVEQSITRRKREIARQEEEDSVMLDELMTERTGP